MKRNIFFSKKNNTFYILITLILLIILYFISFYININKSYFIIENDIINYSIIPKDKKGEKVKYLDKKSINTEIKLFKESLNNPQNLKFTIQLFSNTDYNKVDHYMANFINFKSEIISKDDIYLFGLKSDFGIDYFLTYKNFISKNDAINFCNKSNILSECLILNFQNE